MRTGPLTEEPLSRHGAAEGYLHRILVIVPYYGQYPSLMPLWLRSCAANPTVDWMIVSDQPPAQPLPANVRFARMTLEDLWRRAVERLHPETAFPTPYKLCDWRPMFGVLFAEFIKGYDFWGHCDLDLVFGQVRTFLTPDILAQHDKILFQGCFSLYRNSPALRALFRCEGSQRGWTTVLTDPRSFVFDEDCGIHAIARQMNVRIYLADIIADITPLLRRPSFSRRLRRLDEREQRFVWHNGRVFQHFAARHGATASREFLLIHIQKRRLRVSTDVTVAPCIAFTAKACAGADNTSVQATEGAGDRFLSALWVIRYYLCRPYRRFRRWRRDRTLLTKANRQHPTKSPQRR